jgi:hypothetical protein
MKTNDRVYRFQDQLPNSATVLMIKGGNALIQYDEGGQGWWPVDLLEIIDSANWPAFLAALLQSATFGAAQIGAQQILDAELPTAEGLRLERLLRASTALASLPAVLLAAAQSGDPSLFIGAWLSLRQADLVAPDVATGIAQLATAYNLPEDLIRSLGAPDQPA